MSPPTSPPPVRLIGSETQMVGGNFVAYIPEKLLFEILIRLSVQDIHFGARLVCRKWYHMTRTKSFVHKHLEHASYGLLYQAESRALAFISAREDGGIETYKLNHYGSFAALGRVWSDCHGLMLRFRRPSGTWIYYVTNVSTNTAFPLPPFPYSIYAPESSGIGYDAASMTYKVVAVYHDKLRHRCAILTLGVDKSWRRLPTDVTDHLLDLGGRTLCCFPVITEGFFHWKRPGSLVVVTLNLETEIISHTSPPMPARWDWTECYCLSTGTYLSLFIPCRKLVWEVFEMKPETTEWRKLPNLCLESEKGRIERLGCKHDDVDFVPCGWLKYPEVLAFFIQPYSIIFYNLITCEIGTQRLPTFESTFTSGKFLVTLHKNSLVWLGTMAPELNLCATYIS